MGGNQPGTQSTRSHSKSDGTRILGSGNVWGEVNNTGWWCADFWSAVCSAPCGSKLLPGFCRYKQATRILPMQASNEPKPQFLSKRTFLGQQAHHCHRTATSHHKVGRARVLHHIQCAQNDKRDTPKKQQRRHAQHNT